MCFSAFTLWFSDVGVQYPDWLNMNVWPRESWSGGDCMCSVCGHHLLLTCLCVIFLSEPEFLTAKPGLRPPHPWQSIKPASSSCFISHTEAGKNPKQNSVTREKQKDLLWWPLSTGLVSHSWVVALPAKELQNKMASSAGFHCTKLIGSTFVFLPMKEKADF